MSAARALRWKVHTPNLLKEIASNPQLWAVVTPLQIFANLLAEVAERAIELGDDQLNQLMLRLTLYEQADPESRDFVRGLVEEFVE